jgi:capsular exopolysaccharide synthesis family protein
VVAQSAVSLSWVFRFKWTLLAVFVAVAAPAVTAIWVLVTPLYEAKAEIRVGPIIPRLVFKTEENGMIPLYQSFVNTQVSVMRSPTVLQRVLDSPAVQKTEWYRPERRLFGEIAEPIERLRDGLVVTPRDATEIIDVTFTGPVGGDTEVIVNAVLDQYIKCSSERSDATEDNLYRQLKEQYKTLETEISGREKVLAALHKGLGTGTPAELVSAKRVRLDQAEARFGELHRQMSSGMLVRKELQKVIRSEDQAKRQAEKLQFVRSISSLSTDARQHLRLELGEQKALLWGQVAEAKRLLWKIGTKPPPGNPTSQDAAGQADCDEIAAGIGIIEREIEAIKWRETELSKSLERRDAKEAHPTTRRTVRPEYYTDLEWRQRDVAVRAARARLEVMRVSLRDSSPALAGARSELDLSECLLQSREAALDEQLQRGPTAVEPPGGREGALWPQTDVAGASPAANLGWDLTRVELGLALLQQERILLEEQVRKDRDDLERAFDGAQTLEKEGQAVAYKRVLFNAVRERLDQKEMERNVPGPIELLTRAMVPSKPSEDRRVIFTIMALVVAFLMGLALAFLRGTVGHPLRSEKEMVSVSRVPVVGRIPKIGGNRAAVGQAVLREPLAAEAYRMIEATLAFGMPGTDHRTLLVTSPESMDGKSTFVSNLGITMAKAGQRVVIVDADWRRPSQHEIFQVTGEKGLSTVLAGKDSLEDAIQKSPIAGLDVLPAGPSPADPYEMLGTLRQALSDLLTKLADRYHQILLDSPPVIVADPLVLAGLCKTTLLVLWADRSRRDDVKEAMRGLRSVRARVLGTVVVCAPGTRWPLYPPLNTS